MNGMRSYVHYEPIRNYVRSGTSNNFLPRLHRPTRTKPVTRNPLHPALSAEKSMKGTSKKDARV